MVLHDKYLQMILMCVLWNYSHYSWPFAKSVNIKNYGINSGTVSLLLINIAPNSIVAVKKPVNHFHCSFFTPVTSLIIILYFFLATLNLPENLSVMVL